MRLECSQLAWVSGSADDAMDQCAHGCVTLEVGEQTFLRPSDGQWTVSAAALSLLRTLEHDHTSDNRVTDGNPLFPCCALGATTGHGEYGVYLFGCNSGIDVWVERRSNSIVLSSGEMKTEVSTNEWRKAVAAFAGSGVAFYDSCAPKIVLDDEHDRVGWAAFWQEFSSRLASAHRRSEFG